MLRTSLTQSTKALSLSADVSGYVAVGSGGGGNETVKRLPLYTKATIGAIGYLTPDAKVAFIQLRKVFIKALILCYFDLECHIQIKTDVSAYAIGRVLSQLILNNLGKWHLIGQFFKKMILAKNW